MIPFRCLNMYWLYALNLPAQITARQIQTSKQKRKFSTTPINDRQLLSQKIRKKISVIKTNSFDWELLTFDGIKKIHFGILIHVLS